MVVVQIGNRLRRVRAELKRGLGGNRRVREGILFGRTGSRQRTVVRELLWYWVRFGHWVEWWRRRRIEED